jgi:cytochrome c553
VRRPPLVLLLFVLPGTAGAQTVADRETFFEVRVRPVLAGRCFKCHGGDKVSSGLRVDSREALLKGGERGPALVPGDAAKSLLLRAMRHQDEGLKMPPNAKLSEQTVQDIATWIGQGAAWPATTARPDLFAAQKHWAFRLVQAVAPPPDPTRWSNNPVDRFVATRRHAEGLKPVREADRLALLRRVTFDLIGLPPSPEEVRTFLADQRPDAYERLVDRLLSSSHYGERWGRHWMDVVRYADTAGDNADYPVPEARLYRDWIIDAFNADKPFDQFLREQLAGDVLAREGPRERYAEQVIATTFLGLSRRYLTAPYEQWHLTLEDTIDTVGRAFLGLTVRCARCHDHKFDPVTKEDYYALYGIFASTQFPFAGSEEFASMKRPREHFVSLRPAAEAAPLLEARSRKLSELQTTIARMERERQPADKLNPLRGQLEALRRTNLPPELPGAYAVSEGKPVDVAVHIAGDPDRTGPVVKRGVPKFLTGRTPFIIAPDSSGRLELARWLTSPDNPLTARVFVNRVWQWHFGKGLVATPSNFGLRGEAPTHPELLDWLASEFVRGGWSVKRLHRLIVLSRTYRLASADDTISAARDPGNRWYWRFDRRRLDAESLRDAMLAASGRLDLRRPGPHPFPPITAWSWTQHAPFKDVYPSDHRSVYLMTQRLKRHPFLALFDGPDTNVSTDTRTSSTVPLQALFVLNNRWAHEQAEGLARRVLSRSSDGNSRVDLAFELTWGRPASHVELQTALRYVERYRDGLARSGVSGESQEVQAWSSLARVLLAANEFIYVD